MEITEIPFGAMDSELKEWEYTIPEGFTAEIKDGKVIVKEKENEDERIRKDIISHFESIKALALYDNQEESDGTISSCNEKIAWLERQKEHLRESTKMADKSLEEAAEEYATTHFRNKEFPTVDSAFIAGANYQKGRSSAWSEEDENMLNSCISSIEEAKENRYYYRETDGDTSYDHEISWLKSLRHLPQWKPTEEQMKAFNSYIKDFQEKAEAAVGGWNNFDVMIRLYEQLKKLI